MRNTIIAALASLLAAALYIYFILILFGAYSR